MRFFRNTLITVNKLTVTRGHSLEDIPLPRHVTGEQQVRYSSNLPKFLWFMV